VREGVVVGLKGRVKAEILKLEIKMKESHEIIKGLLIYAAGMVVSILFYFLIINFTETQTASGIVKVFSSLLFLGLIYFFGKGFEIKWGFPILTSFHVILIICVLVLFILNNISQKYYYHVDLGYESFKSQLLFFGISSSYEEITERGFLQNYIDNKLKSKHRISKGIIATSIVFTLWHLYFFTFMPLVSAIFSLIILVFFSLVMGILMRETKSLLLVCFLHILVNYIHTFVQMF
jgi:membrane protease YdiL (CAAX protease family)